jgi:hypothetical protein
MTPKRTRPSGPKKRPIAKARRILRRVEELDACGCWDFENTRNRELAALRLFIDLLEGPYLTLPGREYVEELLGWSEQWIDDAEIDDAEEE